MAEHQHFRIFLSSPDDVRDERDAARQLVQSSLSAEPFLAATATFEIVAWDMPGSSVPMPAHLPPHDAVNRSLLKPSECDIVIVILWSKTGTPIGTSPGYEPGGSPCTGTLWEYEDAVSAARASGGKPIVLLYRRTERPSILIDDPELDVKRTQFEAVQRFFERFRNPDGSHNGSYHSYGKASDFPELLRSHLLQEIRRLLQPALELSRAATAPAFNGRIERFLDEYLKAETSAAPFGGRDAELARLDAWLADTEDASRYLLTGPAGRGKSALVVRWIERLQRRGMLAVPGDASGGWHLAFVPISIRFATNNPVVFYQALAERLAAIAGKVLDKPPTDAANFYLDCSRDLLTALSATHQRVLVVLDGLDEALRGDFDPAVFPRMLPPGIRVLVTARWLAGDYDSSGWIKRLDWADGARHRSLELGTLDHRAIGDVLVKLGAPLDVVAADPGLLTRLAELTNGEPLLVRFYALDLWAKGKEAAHITRADLDSMKPGFTAYFDRWLEFQRRAWRDAQEPVNEHNVDAVLMSLAFAHGPLEGADLMSLVSRFPQISQTSIPQRLLEPMRRFVIGDGSAERGYVLSHPRIGEYLRNERFRSARKGAERAFVEWGRESVASLEARSAGQAEPPRYLLRWYRTHLETINAARSDFLALLSDVWRRAREAEDGGESGFAGDVRAAWLATRRDGELADPLAQLRCLLILASIRSLGRAMPPALLAAAVHASVLTLSQALYLAGFMKNRGEYALTLGTLASECDIDASLRDNYLKEAQSVARDLESSADAAEVLAALAGLTSGEQRALAIELAVESARKIGGEHSRVRLLAIIASQSDADLRGDVLTEANAISGEYPRSIAIKRLIPLLHPAHRTVALEMMRAIRDPAVLAYGLADISKWLTPEQRTEALRQALEAANRIADISPRSRALVHISGCMPPSMAADMLATVVCLESDFWRAATLVGIAAALPDALCDRALTLVTDLMAALAQDLEMMVEALAVARSPTQHASLKHAIERQLQGVSRLEIREKVLRELDRPFSSPRQIELCETFAPEAIAAPMEPVNPLESDPFDPTSTRSEEYGMQTPFLEVVRRVRRKTWGDSMPGSAPSERSVLRAYSRTDAYLPLARAFGAEPLKNLLKEALAEAKSIADLPQQALVLCGIAQRVAPEERATLLKKAFMLVERISDPTERFCALFDLAACESPFGRFESAGRALDCIARFPEIDEHRYFVDRTSQTTGEAIVVLAPLLSPQQRMVAFSMAQSITSVGVRLKVLEGIAHLLDPKSRATALSKAKALRKRNRSRKTAAENLYLQDYESSQASLLMKARVSPGSHSRLHPSRGDSASAPIDVAGSAESSSVQSLLRNGDTLTRSELLIRLYELLPELEAMGGVSLLRGLIAAIHDSVLWYP